MKPPVRPRRALPAKAARLAVGVLIMALADVSTALRGAVPLRVCYSSTAAALVPLAKLRGFYAAEGVAVETRGFPSGAQALDAMLAGQCALATAAVPPVVAQSVVRQDFRIVAAISSSQDFERIVVRADRGIRNAADLRGRRIGVPRNTSAHYFLDVFLVANGLTPAAVQPVFLPVAELAPAFRRGEVDAIAHWEPHIQALVAEFGEGARVFSAAGLVVSPFLLLVRVDALRQQPAAIEQVLRALLRAQRDATARPAAAKDDLAPEMAVAAKEIEALWAIHEFRVVLDQPLLFTLENAARWQFAQMPLNARPVVPNYLDFVDPARLLAVQPKAVGIIR